MASTVLPQHSSCWPYKCSRWGCWDGRSYCWFFCGQQRPRNPLCLWKIMRCCCAFPALDAACAGDVAVTCVCELMTGDQRVRFAGCVPVTGGNHAVETLLQALASHPGRRCKGTSCLLLIHDCFSAQKFKPCTPGCPVIPASDRGAVRVGCCPCIFHCFFSLRVEGVVLR